MIEDRRVTHNVSAKPFIAAVREEWAKAHGTILIPLDFQLTDVIAYGEQLTAQVADSTGARFGIRVKLPPSEGRDDGASDDEVSPEHWALWNVLVPLVEEIETDTLTQSLPDANGVRWVTLT